MIRLYSVLMSLFAYEHSSSFLSVSNGITGALSLFVTFVVRKIINFGTWAFGLLKEFSWVIIKFVLGVVDAFQYMINEFLGVDTSVQDMVDYAEDVDNINFVQVLSKTFRAIVAVAIVLLIIFTIIAIVRQEYNNAVKANSSGNNDKKPLIMGLFKKMLYIVLLPLTMIFILTGVNSILTAFSRAMTGKNNLTIAAQVLASSTYDSNKYRYYAQQNKRIPIVIRTYDPDDYNADENDLLIEKIQSLQVQDALRTTAVNISSNNLLTFKESLTYKNNKLVNSIEYGDIYERFICTPEQYQVMAEFIDYAQQTNMNFQIRAINDSTIDWAYVDSAVFNPNDVSLKINYRDASDLDNDGTTSDTYTIEYSSSFEVTSPITDSLKSVMALLGIDDYSDNLYKTMERDENYVNLVNWANEKVLIKLTGKDASHPFKLEDPTTWSRIDQLIMYEYYHFASNNTFGNYSIDDLKTGVELDASQICYREYYSDAGAYSPERVIDCVEINNSYYHIEKDPLQTDEYGNVYYVLKDALDADESGSFLKNDYSVIEKSDTDKAALKLSSTFNFNDPTTWSYSDQILVYEYYKDLTYNNELYIYNFSEFKNSQIEVPVYNITHKQLVSEEGASETTDDKMYILINGTYYEANDENTDGTWLLYNPTATGASDQSFLTNATSYKDTYYYNYVLSLNDANSVENHGISTDETALITADKLIISVDDSAAHSHAEFVPIEQSDDKFDDYTDYGIQFSKNFNYADVDTWTYQDYFLFYLYAKYPKITNGAGLETLRVSGLGGNIGTINYGTVDEPNNKYVFQVKYGNCTASGCNQSLYFYIDIDNARNVSNMLINNELDVSTVMSRNYVDRENLLFVEVEKDLLVTSDTEVYKFNFSEKFEESFPGNWTVLDYILYIFSKEGKIGSLDSLKENGYSSVKYTTADNNVYYQFGKSEDNTFLSLNGIKSLVDNGGNLLNFQKETDFLNLDLVDYVAKFYQTSQSTLITDEDGITDVLFKDLSRYIYNADTIIQKIIDDNGFNINTTNKFNVFDYVSEYTYTSSAKINDISTWSAIDALVYALTGTIRKSITSNIIDCGGVKYFIFDDKAIDISSDTIDGETNPFKASLLDENVINSITTGFVAGTDSVLTYVHNYYSDKIVSVSALASKKITNYSTSEFSYTKNSSTSYTVFDLIYECIKETAINNGETLSFKAYSDGTEIYLKINEEKYVKVTDDFNNDISISRKAKLTLINESSIATKLDAVTYTSFGNIIDESSNELDLTSLTYTKLDAIIYSLTKKTDTIVYPVYEYDGEKYIYVANKYLLVDDSTGGTTSPIDNNSYFANINVNANDSIDDTIVNTLYNDYYYSKYYSTKIGTIVPEETQQVRFEYVKANTDETIKITELSPLALIFSKLGLINIKSNESVYVDGTIVKTQRGEEYFYYNNTIGITNYEFYIKIDDIAHTYQKDQEADTIYLVDNAYSKYKMILQYLLLNNGVSERNYVNSYLTFDSEIKTVYGSKVENIETDLITETELDNVADFDYTNPSTWTLFNILNYNLSYKTTIESLQNVYVDSTGNKYVKATYGARNVYIQIGDSSSLFTNLFTKFTTEATSYDKNTADGLDPFGIIASQLTGRDSATADENVQHVTISDTILVEEVDFYFITSEMGYTAHHVVYGLDGSVASINNGQTNAVYSYLYNGTTNITEWTILDIMIADIYNGSSYTDVMSNLYIYGSEAYLIVSGQYVNVAKIGLFETDEINEIYNNIGTSNDSDKTITNNTIAFKELFFSTTGAVGKNAIVVDDSIIATDETPEDAEPEESEDAETEDETANRIYFSDNFDVSDYSTWSLADVIIYYMFTEHSDYFMGETDAIKSIKNFQELVKQGYVPAYEYNYTVTDEFGGTTVEKVLWLGVNKKGDGIALNKKVFQTYYAQQLSSIHYKVGADKLIVSLGKTANGVEAGSPLPDQTVTKFYLARNIALNTNDFIYNNNYYFSLDYTGINALRAINFTTIANGTASMVGSINIKLSDGFFDDTLADNFINKPSEWTWLDFIVIYEFSNTAVRHNFFEGMTFEELGTDNYLPIYSVGDELIIQINGNYYNLNKLVYTDDGNAGISQTDINSIRASKLLKVDETSEIAVSATIHVTDDDSYQMKTLFNQHEYFVKTETDHSLDYSKTPESILFSYNDDIYFMELDTNLVSNYSINIASLECNDNYTLTNIVREVNWPQKLMNDLQVLYPDLNWSTLIATDGWIDTLGEFSSAQASGEFKSEGNSANITAAGLVLSEFFLSVTKEQEDFTSYNEYEYEPVFDENTIKSLMLAMLGEEEYNDLSMQAEVFIDMFNDMFVPILEDVAAERGVEIVDGKVDNFYISVYKAYMATVLLSSDMGEYFYKIATRVYAQYTIYESLASASGDYAAYKDYINGDIDENGEEVTAFRYSTFHELAIYENSFKGNLNPTFTFNFLSTLRGLYGSDVTYKYLNDKGLEIDSSLRSSTQTVDSENAADILSNEKNFEIVLNDLNSRYKQIYISSGSKLSDSNDSGYYCFMLDVYWSIKQDLNKRNQADPIYLKNYYSYIVGDIKRWVNVSDNDITASSALIPNQPLTEISLKLQMIDVTKTSFEVYIPDPDLIDFEVEFDDEGTASILDTFKSLLNEATISSYSILEDTFRNDEGQYSEYRRAFEDLFYNPLGGNEVTSLLITMISSEGGDVDDWKTILSIRDDLELLISELANVMGQAPGTFVEGDKARGYRSDNSHYTDERYQNAYTELKNFHSAIETYIETQEKIDTAIKASINFTLAQFGKNYVSEGYSFQFENKSYTLKSTVSPERLAEYVYGGAFLDQYGVPATYTNSEYNGFVQSYKFYDSTLNSVVTDLDIWPELRSFVSELANYTSKLYYLSNLNDLSENVGDAVKLTDIVYKGSGSSTSRTLEHIILEYILSSDISADTLMRLMFGDSVSTLDGMFESGTSVDETDKIKFYALAHYLDGTYISSDSDNDGSIEVTFNSNGTSHTCELTSSEKRNILIKYLDLISTDGTAGYNSYGYYNSDSNTGADRIHIIFKKVISYLVATEESGESVSEETINLDDINFKEFRKILIKALSTYQKNPSETDLENSNRYITLFNLICSQFSYSYGSNVNVGTSISSIYLIKNADGQIYYENLSASNALHAEFSIDIPTRDIILTLAGVENRPIEELVALEYDMMYKGDGEYDEADGDTFVVCTYNENEGKYYPVLARNTNLTLTESSSGYKYIQNFDIDVTTKYYDSNYCYPIVAKGIIDAAGQPTAIRIVDNSVQFYRTAITGTTKVSNTSLAYAKNTGDVTTVGYTKYVAQTFTAENAQEKQAMFTGASSVDTVLNADFMVYLIQFEEAYSISDKENYDSISVLDQFAAFYTLEIRQYALFILGFVTIIPMLFKASAAVLHRILDLILLVLMGPVAIASTSINPENNGQTSGKIFDTWKDYMTKTLLCVFGYIIAFNIYYILVTTVMNMDFVTDATMNTIYKVAGLSSIITKDSVNAFMRLLFMLSAASVIETSADLLINIVTAGKANSAFTTPMASDVMKDIKQMAQEIKRNMDRAKTVISGEIIFEAKDFAIETAKNMIPGSSIARGAVHLGQNIATDIKAKNLEKLAAANGISPSVAKKLSSQYAQNEKKTREVKRDKQRNSANKFMKDAFDMKEDMYTKPYQPKPRKKPDKDKKKSKGSKDKNKKKKK